MPGSRPGPCGRGPPTHSNLRADTAQWIGFLDKDMDGMVQKDEMPKRLYESIGWFRWWFIDTDFNGGLDLAEMETLVEAISDNDDDG